MSVDLIRQCANVVLKTLRRHGHDDECTDLERLIEDLDHAGRVERTLHEMIARCDIAVFGELSVGAMPLTEWWAWLRRLRESCREELEDRQLEALREAARTGVPLPLPDTLPAARTPSPERIGRGFQPRALALLSAGARLLSRDMAAPQRS